MAQKLHEESSCVGHTTVHIRVCGIGDEKNVSRDEDAIHLSPPVVTNVLKKYRDFSESFIDETC